MEPNEKALTKSELIEAWQNALGIRNRTPVFHCCYCAMVLDNPNDETGVCLFSTETGKLGQIWFAHESCFRERLHPEYDIDPEEEEAPAGEAGAREGPADP